MPSIAMSDSITTPETLKKEKKMKSAESPDNIKEKKSSSKKDKSSSKKDKEDKKKKKRKLDDSPSSDTSSELVQAAVDVNPKKPKLSEVVAAAAPEVVKDDPNALSNFRISKPLKDILIKKGIKALFPIQAMTFDNVFDGCDLVGRARTGQGKTLAFVLPIIESLVNGRTKELRKTGYGRLPSVLVLLPTRELATQVLADFQAYGGALGLTACSVYGGTPFNAQITSLNRGVDVVVGTPGRVKDLLEKGILKLGSLLFRVLDEADEMLKMGFVDDVELILGKVDDVSKVQTLLFSATLPSWVKTISQRFLKSAKKTVDLVSDQTMKASTSVRHIVIPCSAAAMTDLIPDIIRCYGSGGRSIVFTETKEHASQLSSLLSGARPLHGDIQQSQREITLKGFRSGKFMTLVATNVAARGLDINDVQLIVQCQPPRDVEDYIHRSGRTGRAGNTGVAVMLYDPKKSNFSRIERESGVKFEYLSAPQPADVAKAAGVEAAEAITQISDSVISAFKDAAEELLSRSGLSAVEILAKALAKAAGYSDIKERSLLTGMEGYVTLLLESGSFYGITAVFSALKRFLPESKVSSVKGISITADKRGAVFDVPVDDLETFLVGSENATGVSLEVVKALPPLEQQHTFNRFGGGGGNRFGGRGGRGGGFSRNGYGGGGGGRFGGRGRR